MQDNNTTSDERFDLIELDLDRAPAKPAAAINLPEERPIELDVLDKANPACIECGEKTALDAQGRCYSCYTVRNKLEIPAAPSGDSLVSGLAGIAAEAAANAHDENNAVTATANGRSTLGVGFNSAEGYAEALRRGVLPHTRTEYEQTLRSRYNWTQAQIDAIPPATIGGQDLPVGKGIVHEGNAEAAARHIAEYRAKKAVREARELNVAKNVEPEKAVHLRHGDVVAGAVADGHGILTHWAGSGPLTVAKIVEVATAAGVPADRLPKAKDAKSYANHAVNAIAARLGYTAAKCKRDQYAANVAWDARWHLYARNAAAGVGDAAGHVVCVVTLDAGKLAYEGEGLVGAAIEAEFNLLREKEILQAGHVTTWLGNLLRDWCNGVKYGGCWYVPKNTRERAEAVVAAFAAVWGSDWMNPATPIATSAQLAKGIAQGLANEVDATLAQLESENAHAAQELADAKAAGKETKALGHIGDKAAQTYLRKFREHAERVKLFAELLGAELVASSKAKVEGACKSLDLIVGDTTGIVERFAAVWDEIEYDLAKSEESGDGE